VGRPRGGPPAGEGPPRFLPGGDFSTGGGPVFVWGRPSGCGARGRAAKPWGLRERGGPFRHHRGGARGGYFGLGGGRPVSSPPIFGGGPPTLGFFHPSDGRRGGKVGFLGRGEFSFGNGGGGGPIGPVPPLAGHFFFFGPGAPERGRWGGDFGGGGGAPENGKNRPFGWGKKGGPPHRGAGFAVGKQRGATPAPRGGRWRQGGQGPTTGDVRTSSGFPSVAVGSAFPLGAVRRAAWSVLCGLQTGWCCLARSASRRCGVFVRALGRVGGGDQPWGKKTTRRDFSFAGGALAVLNPKNRRKKRFVFLFSPAPPHPWDFFLIRFGPGGQPHGKTPYLRFRPAGRGAQVRPIFSARKFPGLGGWAWENPRETHRFVGAKPLPRRQGWAGGGGPPEGGGPSRPNPSILGGGRPLASFWFP